MAVNTESQDLRQIARNIERLDGTGLDLGGKASLAAALYVLIKKADTVLASLKDTLREEAIRQGQGNPGPQIITATDGSKCTVMIYGPTVKPRKDVDWASLKASLGAAWFNTLFDEVTTFKVRRDFQEQAETLQDPNQIQAVMGAVDLTAETPRVFFKDE